MTGAENAEFAARKSAFDADKARSQSIILQSNTRASGIAQLLAAILTLIGIAAAVVVGLGSMKVSTSAAVFAWIATAALLVSLFGLVSVKWPRLGRLPRDKSVMAYERRINTIAEAYRTEHVLDYEEGHDLQRIVFIKERSTQIALAGMLALSVSSVMSFLLVFLSR